MNNNNAQSNALSSSSLNPATIKASEDAIAKTKARLIEMGGTPQEFVDPMIEARKNSPLLQFLAATQDATVLPDATIPSVPPSLSINNLCEVEAWNKVSDALTQIYAHGFEVGDTVCLRLIPAKNIPQDAFQKLRLAKAKNFDLELLPDGKCRLIPYKYEPTGENKKDGAPAYRYVKNRSGATFNWLTKLAELNRKGYGIYLLPNKGGHTDKEITHYQNAFYEVDDKSFEQQQAQLNDFTAKTGIAPSVVVRTRKSLHVYFRFAKSEWQISDWSDGVQKPTILALQSDPSIHNRARPMRLAGFYHVKYQSGEFNFQLVDMWVCNPQNEYTRAQYLQALEQYSGHKYSEARQKVLHLITTKTNQEYFYLDSNNLLPKPHQVAQCPEELIEELEKRTSAYISLLRKEHACELVDSSDAWVKPLSELTKHRTFDFSGLEDDGEEKDIIRWAKYLYGYNPDGRPGWITGQDPTVPESECDNHSIDSLHINATTGQYKSHRGTDNSEVYQALKELAFRSNPEEKQIYSAKWRRIGEQQRKLEGEISEEDYKAKGLKPELTPEEFNEQERQKAIAAELQRLKEDKEFQDYLKRISVDPAKATKYYKCDERYLSDKTFAQIPTIAECEKKGHLLALKAPKGTGKSQRIKQLIKAAKDAKWLIISVTPRVNLGIGQANEWEIPWIAEEGIEKFINDQENHMSCCWDSFHKFDRKDYRNKQILFIIDEVESGLEHLSTSSTFKGKGNRARVYAQLHRLMSHINKCGGLVVAADADLSDISLDFLRIIGEGIPNVVIENTHIVPKKSIPVFHTKDGEIKASIKASIEFGMPFLVACDTKEDVKDLHLYATEQFGKLGMGDQVHRLWSIHSGNATEDANKERIKDFDTAIRKESPIGVFFSPTITVGMSIDVQYFTEGFGIFKGTVSPDVARQMVGRNREIVPWSIFADNIADQAKKSKRTPTTPETVAGKLLSQIKNQAHLTQWISEKLLTEDTDADDDEIREREIQLIRSLKTETATLETAEFHLLCRIIAKHNYQKQNYHKCFLHGMESEGWTVESKKGTKNALSEELKELREKRRVEESEFIASADHLLVGSVDLAREILQTSNDKKMRAAAEKVILADRCKIAVEKIDAELVGRLKFNYRWWSGVKFEWLLRNPEIAKIIDAKRMNKLAKDTVRYGKNSFLDSLGNTPEIKAIRDFGLLNVIDFNDDERTYTRKDFMPLVNEMKNWKTSAILKWAEEAGLSFEKRGALFENPVGNVIRPMLAKLGYTFPQYKRNAKGHNTFRIPPEELNDIYRASAQDGLTADWHEKQAEQELQRTRLNEVKLIQEAQSLVIEQGKKELVTA